jgi:hypothetical protein
MTKLVLFTLLALTTAVAASVLAAEAETGAAADASSPGMTPEVEEDVAPEETSDELSGGGDLDDEEQYLGAEDVEDDLDSAPVDPWTSYRVAGGKLDAAVRDGEPSDDGGGGDFGDEGASGDTGSGEEEETEKDGGEEEEANQTDDGTDDGTDDAWEASSMPWEGREYFEPQE